MGNSTVHLSSCWIQQNPIVSCYVQTAARLGLLRFDPYTYTESVFYRSVVRSVVRSVLVRIKPQQAYARWLFCCCCNMSGVQLIVGVLCMRDNDSDG